MKIGLAVVCLLALAGCSSTNISELIKAMSGDPATVCATGTYAGALINVARTNITNGEVTCNGNGLTIKSQAVQLGLPAQVTIQQPAVVAPPR